MKQIIQDLNSGKTILEEVPAPAVKPGQVLIQTTRSLVSIGTERMLVEFGKSNLFQKAKQQPDKVKEVINKIKTDGLSPTINAVFNKLGQPIPLGYCNVGKVIAVGRGVDDFSIGDRVKLKKKFRSEYPSFSLVFDIFSTEIGSFIGLLSFIQTLSFSFFSFELLLHSFEQYCCNFPDLGCSILLYLSNGLLQFRQFTIS